MNIKLHYYNELYFKVETDPSIEYEIQEEFSYYANGYKYHPKVKLGIWDGKIRLYNRRDKTLYSGLLFDLFKLSKERNYTIEIINKELFKPQITISDEWLDTFEKESIIYEYRDYQRKSIKQALKHNKLLILSPTGSGKSLVNYTLARALLDNSYLKNRRLLINVPSINLVNQLFEDFKEYTKDDFNVEKYVTKAGGDNREDINKPIVISTWQTTMNKDQSYFENIYAYILDEAHQAPANEITKIFDKLHNTVFRIGTTGTLDGTDLHEIGMRARFGKLYRAATTKELMDAGDLAKLFIQCYVLKYSKASIKEMRKKIRGKQAAEKYKGEIDYIVESETRNEFLKTLGFSQPKNTLMLFNYVDKHGKVLYEQMKKDEDKELKKVYFISGTVKGEEREAIRQTLDKKEPIWHDVYFDKNTFVRFKSNEYVKLSNTKELIQVSKIQRHSTIDNYWLEEYIKTHQKYIVGTLDFNNLKVYNVRTLKGSSVLLASYGTLAVGVNIKNLHTLILCHPVKGQIRLLQSIGRVLRKANDKNEVTVIDVIDQMTHETKKSKFVNTLYKHFIARLDIYEKEQFEYDLEEINLEN